MIPFKEYYSQKLKEVKIEPEIKDQTEFSSIKDINPKEQITPEYSIRVQEPSEYSEGYVFLYDSKTGKIVTRMFWNFNSDYGINVPQPHMVETHKEHAGRGLSLLVYKELISWYYGLLSDEKLTVASLNNWSKKLFPVYKNNIFLINDDSFEAWDGSINLVVNTNKKLIILMNASDIKRLQRKYNS
jgi:hypothetical protein